jgi:hypothetical protein
MYFKLTLITYSPIGDSLGGEGGKSFFKLLREGIRKGVEQSLLMSSHRSRMTDFGDKAETAHNKYSFGSVNRTPTEQTYYKIIKDGKGGERIVPVRFTVEKYETIRLTPEQYEMACRSRTGFWKYLSDIGVISKEQAPVDEKLRFYVDHRQKLGLSINLQPVPTHIRLIENSVVLKPIVICAICSGIACTLYLGDRVYSGVLDTLAKDPDAYINYMKKEPRE